MKSFKLIIWGILLLYVQILLAMKFAVLGIIPNFLIAYIIFVNLRQGWQSSMAISFFFGLALDLVQPNLLGLHSLSFLIISLLIQKFHTSINKKRLIFVLFSVLFLNIIYYLIFVLYHFISMQSLSGFFLYFFFAVGYNTLCTVCLNYLFIMMSNLKIVLDV